MSGIYISGMEMPRNCHNCPLCFMRCCCANGNELTEKQTRPNAERLQDCPLIPVPDHGRLIDADALQWYLKDVTEILDAPTIIHADKEEQK